METYRSFHIQVKNYVDGCGNKFDRTFKLNYVKTQILFNLYKINIFFYKYALNLKIKDCGFKQIVSNQDTLF